MNGAFFGTKQVITNFVNMVSCKRAKHGIIKKSFMVIFLVYTSILYALQFFIVGAMFAAIYAFYDQFFASIFEGGGKFELAYDNGLFTTLFTYYYIFLIVMVLIFSLALPLEKGKIWFNIVVIAFGFLTTFTIFGMVYYLSQTGLYPQEKHYNANTDSWELVDGVYNFSYLVFAGIIMLSIYLVPFVMRPIDFLGNIGGYTVGLIAYILLVPMYINVFSIYSFSNLHDVSWGNRPSTTGTGTEAFSANKIVQEMTQKNYKEFRANVLFIWIICNAAYFYIVLSLGASADPSYVNDGSFGPL